MKKEFVEPSVWYKNFSNAAQELIEEQRNEGYLVQGFIVTEGLYQKLTDALGYEPDNLLGYKLEILEQNESELAEEGDMMLVSGQPIC